MRAFRAGLAAIAFGTMFAAGCSPSGSGGLASIDTSSKAVETLVTKLATETFKGKATAAADIASVRDALPKEVSLTWGNLSFDAASGATVLTNVKLTPKDMPQVGLGIDELRLFDFDAAFAKARLTGQRLTETASLASRIDAKGVSLFGVAQVLNQAMGGGAPPQPPVAVDPTAPADPNAPPAAQWPSNTEPSFAFDGANFGVSWDSYDFNIGRIIADAVVLRPYEVAAPAAGPNTLAPMGMGGDAFLQYIAVFRAIGMDTFATYDMKGNVGLTQMGQKIAVSFGAKSSGTHGWRGADFDAAYVRDIGYAFSIGGTDPAQPPAMSMNYNVGYMGMVDTHLDKLYGYMAKGVVPPRTETDLMSLGGFLFENQKLNVSGKDIMTIGESTLDARKFHWFIPTSLTASAKNATFDVGAMMQMAESLSHEFAGADPSVAQSIPDFAAITAALEKNGLSKPNLNFNFGWNWNETSGDAKIDLGFGGDNLMQFDAKYEGGFPSFKAVSDLIPDDVEKANTTAIGQLFDAQSTLKLVDVNITDKGGLQKMFDLTADLAPIMAASDPSGVNPLEGQTGASLRQMVGSMITMVGASPDIAPFANPFAAFIMQGGKLHIGLQPSKPMTWSSFGQQLTGPTPSASSPGQALKDLGIKVEHSK